MNSELVKLAKTDAAHVTITFFDALKKHYDYEPTDNERSEILELFENRGISFFELVNIRFMAASYMSCQKIDFDKFREIIDGKAD